jgi:CRP-like cAMP-binding protein
MPVEIDPAAVPHVSCFRGLDDAEAAEAARHIEAVRLAPDEVLFRQGDVADSLYMLLEGKIEIHIHVPGQEDRLLTTMEAGVVFGEIGLLLDEPRSATALAATEAELWRIPREPFQSAVDRHDAWACRVLQTSARLLARRLLALDEQFVALIADVRRNETRLLGTKVAELEELRDRLLTEWSF